MELAEYTTCGQKHKHAHTILKQWAKSLSHSIKKKKKKKLA